jgi:hypothetical protein
VTVLKAYDEGTEQWQTIVVGRQGPAGVVQADLPITYDVGTQTVGSDGSLLVTVEHGGMTLSRGRRMRRRCIGRGRLLR